MGTSDSGKSSPGRGKFVFSLHCFVSLHFFDAIELSRVTVAFSIMTVSFYLYYKFT